VFGEELQEGIVPEERPVFFVEDAQGDFELVERRSQSAQSGFVGCVHGGVPRD
jgi:hypothetical protein